MIMILRTYVNILPARPILLPHQVVLEFRRAKLIRVSIYVHHKVEECTENGGTKEQYVSV